MASNKAIATALGMFAETFPSREVSPRTADVWMAVMADISDEALSRAVLRLCRDPERRFFPTSGEVFAAMALDAPVADPLVILHRIHQLGRYSPQVGWIYPDYETVRQALGEDIAKAYVVVGSEALFADEGREITRDIARRSFGTELAKANQANPPNLRLPPPRPLLMPPVEPPRSRTGREWKEGDPAPLMETVAKVVSEITVETKDEAAA